jgi:hypothetical protein
LSDQVFRALASESPRREAPGHGAEEERARSARIDELAETVCRLATHSAVLAIALRDPHAVPEADLEAALVGIEEIVQAR